MAEETDLGTAYAAQQEDINDKLLLDLAWERQQKKVSALLAGSSKRPAADARVWKPTIQLWKSWNVTQAWFDYAPRARMASPCMHAAYHCNMATKRWLRGILRITSWLGVEARAR